jgi:hypothetical protein
MTTEFYLTLDQLREAKRCRVWAADQRMKRTDLGRDETKEVCLSYTQELLQEIDK